MKDLFSSEAANYALYRPGYPAELFIFLENLLKGRERAWDCGTGNGQVAAILSGFMEQVEGTDISSQQLKNAIVKHNIRYSLQPAEKTQFPDNFFDLVTVGQAVHWFDMHTFYKEVKRVTKPGGILAVMGYGLFRNNFRTNEIIDHFYSKIIGPYWDEERKYLEEKYQTIPFPFKEIEVPEFRVSEIWPIQRLVGYLRTWSAVQHYKRREGQDPVTFIENELHNSFGRTGRIEFPILLRVGEIASEEVKKGNIDHD